jgi:hypothetical protein
MQKLGLKERKQRAQLVARVGNEAPLPLERAFESPEHRVQRLSEASDLVARARQRQPPTRLGTGDHGRLGAHRLNWAKGGRRQGIAEQRGDEERDRPDQKQLGEEARQRLVPVLERCTDDDHDLALGALHGPLERASRPAEATLGRLEYPTVGSKEASPWGKQ